MAHGDQRGRAITDGALHHETARNKRGRSKGLLHDVDSLRNNTRQSPNFIKSESEPKLHAVTAPRSASSSLSGAMTLCLELDDVALSALEQVIGPQVERCPLFAVVGAAIVDSG